MSSRPGLLAELRELLSRLSAPRLESIEVKFSDRSVYIELLKLHNANRIDYNTRKWETLRLTSQLVLGSLGIPFAVLALMQKGMADEYAVPLIGVGLIIALVCWWFGLVNFRRESELLFLEEGMTFRLARHLRLEPEVITDGRLQWPPGDTSLFLHRWRDATHRRAKGPQRLTTDPRPSYSGHSSDTARVATSTAKSSNTTGANTPDSMEQWAADRAAYHVSHDFRFFQLLILPFFMLVVMLVSSAFAVKTGTASDDPMARLGGIESRLSLTDQRLQRIEGQLAALASMKMAPSKKPGARQ